MTRIGPLIALLLALAGCSEDNGQAIEPSDAGKPPADTRSAGPEGATVSERLSVAMSTPEFVRACEETPGCGDADGPSVATQPIWRVQVVRAADGKLRFGAISIAAVPRDGGMPVGPVYGEFALVGVNSKGEVVDGQLIHFPQTLRVEFEEDGQPRSDAIDLTGKVVDAMGYLRASPEIEAIEVRDREENVLVSMPPPAGPEFSWLDQVGDLLGIQTAHAATTLSGLPPHCAHVLILQGAQDEALAVGGTWEGVQNLATPGPFHLASTRAALSKMTPLLCQSIGRIAFVYLSQNYDVYGAVKSVGGGDLITINVSTLLREEALAEMLNRRLKLQTTLVHEAGHTAETLLTVAGSSNDPVQGERYGGEWGLPARSLAKETIENVRLEAGMEAEWQRLHESFVSQGWARPHGSFSTTEGESPDWTWADVVEGGFMNHYGSGYWAEDIATFVENAYYGQIVGSTYVQHGAPRRRSDWACTEMRGHNERSVPAKLAAVYTKLHFLLDLGLVRERDVTECMGSSIGLDISSPGFHVWQDGTRVRLLDTGVTARMGAASSGAPVFEMKAEGQAGFGDETYPAEVKLRLDVGNRFQPFDKISWPRGAYELGLTGDNNFTLRLDGAAAGNFDTMDGFALVAESSHEKIAGSLVIQRVFRLNAPLPVPERYDPPLVIRFMIEK